MAVFPVVLLELDVAYMTNNGSRYFILQRFILKVASTDFWNRNSPTTRI